MKHIPQVRDWIVTTTSGAQFIISAPTRRLALLNFRFEVGYHDIKSIGIKRQERPRPYSFSQPVGLEA